MSVMKDGFLYIGLLRFVDNDKPTGFNWSFNRDGKIPKILPTHQVSEIMKRIRTRDWNNELIVNYPQPRLMTENMQNYTKRFYEMFQWQREAIIHGSKPQLSIFQPFPRDLYNRSQNLVMSYLLEPMKVHSHKYPLLQMLPPPRAAWSPRNYRPRYNPQRDLAYD